MSDGTQQSKVEFYRGSVNTSLAVNTFLPIDCDSISWKLSNSNQYRFKISGIHDGEQCDFDLKNVRQVSEMNLTGGTF